MNNLISSEHIAEGTPTFWMTCTMSMYIVKIPLIILQYVILMQIFIFISLPIFSCPNGARVFNPSGLVTSYYNVSCWIAIMVDFTCLFFVILGIESRKILKCIFFLISRLSSQALYSLSFSYETVCYEGTISHHFNKK